MENKKGFTLVELLAVIAILAILVLIAIPNILNLYRNARKNTFVDEVQNIIRTTEQKYIEDSMSNGSNLCYDSKTNPLDLDSKSSLNYKVELSNDGKITSIQVMDNNYQLIKTNETDIKRDTIKSDEVNTRDKNQGLTDCKGNPIVEGTNTEEEPKFNITYDSMLKDNSDFDIFFVSNLSRDEIESVKFENTIPEEVKEKYQQQETSSNEIIGVADVSDYENEDIMMWWTDTNNNNLYEVTIGGQGGVRANTDSSFLFGNLSNLTTIDLKNLDTSNVEVMYCMFSGMNLIILDLSHLNTTKVIDMSYMFQEGNLETIIFGDNFDTSNVENMEGMFQYCQNLRTIDLSYFNTSSVEDMAAMFSQCEKLTSLDLSHFNTSKVTDMSYMFQDCIELTTLNLSYFNTSSVEDMSGMFNLCGNLETIIFGVNFDTSKVIDMSNMFFGCSSLTDLDLSSFDTSQVTDMYMMFTGCSQLSNLKLSDKFIINDDTNLECMLTGTDALDVENIIPNYLDLDERLVCPSE